MPPPKVKCKYPIHQTAPGPDYMKLAVVKNDSRLGEKNKKYMTYNPIPEGEIFEIAYKKKLIKLRIDMNFYTDPNFMVVEMLEVK